MLKCEIKQTQFKSKKLFPRIFLRKENLKKQFYIFIKTHFHFYKSTCFFNNLTDIESYHLVEIGLIFHLRKTSKAKYLV